MMTAALTNYLLQHHSISIPGLGSIYIEKTPAQTDFVNRRILPPGYHFRFDKYFDAPDKDFFTYLAQQKNMADYEAIRWYNEWAYELRNKIRNNETIEWKGVGTLKKDVSGDVVFETAGPVVTLLKPATAERVIHSRAQHTMIVGDREVIREIPSVEPVEETELVAAAEEPEEMVHSEKSSWWIYALIIAAIALSILFFHFFKNGFNTGATGSQQTIGVPQ